MFIVWTLDSIQKHQRKYYCIDHDSRYIDTPFCRLFDNYNAESIKIISLEGSRISKSQRNDCKSVCLFVIMDQLFNYGINFKTILQREEGKSSIANQIEWVLNNEEILQYLETLSINSIYV